MAEWLIVPPRLQIMTAGADRAGPQPAPPSNCRHALSRLRVLRGPAQSPYRSPYY
jgi:hypothetical protein